MAQPSLTKLLERVGVLEQRVEKLEDELRAVSRMVMLNTELPIKSLGNLGNEGNWDGSDYDKMVGG